MPIDILLTTTGTLSALLLILGMIAGRIKSEWRIWPSPPVGSLKSFLFWSLFRALNVAALALSTERILAAFDGPTAGFRFAFAAISFVSGLAYAYTLWSLGRKATYCQASGLETGGIYRWTRNPQYAMAILAFAALALAAWTPDATLLAAATVIVYVMMAVTEEPWLEARYGPTYLEYQSEVPRFFNFRHALKELRALPRKIPSFADGSHGKR